MASQQEKEEQNALLQEQLPLCDPSDYGSGEGLDHATRTVRRRTASEDVDDGSVEAEEAEGILTDAFRRDMTMTKGGKLKSKVTINLDERYRESHSTWERSFWNYWRCSRCYSNTAYHEAVTRLEPDWCINCNHVYAGEPVKSMIGFRVIPRWGKYGRPGV